MKKFLSILFILLLVIFIQSCSKELNEETARQIIDDMVQVINNADMTDEQALESKMMEVMDNYGVTEQEWEKYIQDHPELEEELANKIMEATFGALGDMQQTDTETGLVQLESSGAFSGEFTSDWGPVTLTQEGDTVFGTYFNEQYNSDGTIQGTITENGDKLEFEWTETIIDDTGEISMSSGSGYFEIKDAGDKLEGEWKNEGDEEWQGSWTLEKKAAQ